MSAKRHPTKTAYLHNGVGSIHRDVLASELPKHLGNTYNSYGTRHKHGIFVAYTGEKAHAYKSADCTITYSMANG